MSKRIVMFSVIALGFLFVCADVMGQAGTKTQPTGAERMRDASQSGMAYASLILSLMLILIGPTFIVWVVCRAMKLEEAGFLRSLYSAIAGFLASLLLFYSVTLLPDALMKPALFYQNTDLLLRGLGVVAICFVVFLALMKQQTVKTVIFTIFYCAALYFAAWLAYKFIDSTGATVLLKGSG